MPQLTDRVAAAAAGCLAVALAATALAAIGPATVAAKPRPHAPGGATQPRARLSNFDGKDAVGRIVNLTPYPWTFVAKGAFGLLPTKWAGEFPTTLQPGQQFIYRLDPWDEHGSTQEYSGWFTYRALTARSGANGEYLTVSLRGSHCTGICFDRDGPALAISAIDGTRAPTTNGGTVDLGPHTVNPEVVWTQSGSANVWPTPLFDGTSASFDFTFQTQGNYTIDASKDPPALPDLLNALCAGAADTSCGFTASGSPTFGPGPITALPAKYNCPTQAIRRSGRPVRGTDEPPPSGDPDWYSHAVKVSREASISVGGSVTASVKTNLFGIVASEVSLKFGAEHEWSSTDTFEKESQVYVPRGWVGGIWYAPVVGKIAGTLVVSTKAATYTITHFQETKSAAQPDLQTPPVDVMTNSRPMTPDEVKINCSGRAGARAAPQPRPPARRFTAGGRSGPIVGPGWGKGTSASATASTRAEAGDRTVIDASKDPTAAGTALDFCQQISNCKFVGTITNGYGPRRAVGDALYNCGQTYAEDSISISDERSQSTSLEEKLSLKVELGFLGLASTSIEAEVNSGQMEKVSLENVDTNEVTVAPGEKGWTDSRAAFAYSTGTASVTDGIHLVDVSNFTLQYPGYAAPKAQPVLFADQHNSLTATEKHDVCAALPPVAGRVGASRNAPVTRIKVCRSELVSLKPRARTIRTCVTRRLNGGVPMAGRRAAVALLRGRVTYATGSMTKTGISLRARRNLPSGKYTLILTRGRRTVMTTVRVR